MLAVRSLDKFSQRSTFFFHKLVPVMANLEEPQGVTKPSSIGADALERYSSSDCISTARTRLYELVFFLGARTQEKHPYGENKKGSHLKEIP